MTNKLFLEQVEYLKKHKEQICRPYLSGNKVGFDLNLTTYFGALAFFELKKVYSTVDDEIFNEPTIIDVFRDVLDSCSAGESDDFSIKESLKMEAKLVLITDYVLKNDRGRSKKVYPSEVRRKEIAINNAHKRVCNIIDNCFKEGDLRYKDIKAGIDIFEVIASKDGKLVDLHFGNGGCSLNKETAKQDILKHVQAQIQQFQSSLSYIEEKKPYILCTKWRLISEGLLTKEQAEKVENLGISSYELRSLPELAIKQDIDEHIVGMENLYHFLKQLKLHNIVIPVKSQFDLKVRTIHFEKFHFNYATSSVKQFLDEWTNYNKISGLIHNLNSELKSESLLTTFVFKQNVLYIEARMKPNYSYRNAHIDGLRDLEVLVRTEDENVKKQPAILKFNCEDGKLFRETGEQVLTSEVVKFEIMEKLRNSDKEYFLTLEKAKNMLFSVLSQDEEMLLKSENATIIEGVENYYAILNQSYNNIIKIPKNIKNVDEMRALCIHPADTSTPMHDGFTSIVLSVKSGDENYILDNSNEFMVQPKIKEKIVNIFNTFVQPKQKLCLA